MKSAIDTKHGRALLSGLDAQPRQNYSGELDIERSDETLGAESWYRLDPSSNISTQTECPRCGKSVPNNLSRCTYCAARLTVGTQASAISDSSALQSSYALESASAVSRLLVLYLLMLVTPFVCVAIEAFTSAISAFDSDPNPALTFTITGEIVDTVILLVALAILPMPPSVSVSSLRQRRIGACMSPLILAISLALNFGYHLVIRNYVQFPLHLHGASKEPIGWAIVLICVQPAIVEELFMRYLALGTLARVMPVAQAICVSSLMFGMAHSHVPMSIPILTVLGVGLGIIRVWSGSILLPILLHALHNAAILFLETTK